LAKKKEGKEPKSHMLLGPLYGGGFWTAVGQVAAIYYGVSAAIHWGIPAVLDVKSIQVREDWRRARQG
jgi:hypothetical protein